MFLNFYNQILVIQIYCTSETCLYEKIRSDTFSNLMDLIKHSPGQKEQIRRYKNKELTLLISSSLFLPLMPAKLHMEPS